MNTNTQPNTFSWHVALLLSLGVGLLVAGLSVFLQTRPDVAYAFRSYTAFPVAAIIGSTTDGLGSSHVAPGNPVRLIIPAIGVDANIQSVGLYWRGDGSMGIPTNFTDVAWYNGGPRPGEPGSAVIDGHYDGRDVREAVFYDLGRLHAGDTVSVVDSNGKTWQFKVVSISAYDFNASTASIFSSDTSAARLNLITCGGVWDKANQTYDKRIVIFTTLVS